MNLFPYVSESGTPYAQYSQSFELDAGVANDGSVWTFTDNAGTGDTGSVSFCVFVGVEQDGAATAVNFREEVVTVMYDLSSEWTPVEFYTQAIAPDLAPAEFQEITAQVLECEGIAGPDSTVAQGQVACMAICPGSNLADIWVTHRVNDVFASAVSNGAAQAIVLSGVAVANGQVSLYPVSRCMQVEWIFDGAFFPDDTTAVGVVLSGSATFLPSGAPPKGVGGGSRRLDERSLEEEVRAEFKTEMTVVKDPNERSGSVSNHVAKITVAAAGLTAAAGFLF